MFSFHKKLPIANFVVAGATRSGTTSLWHYLGQHPDIFLPEQKELWFFNVDEVYEKGLKAYSKMFKGYQSQRMIGDITPMYLTSGLLYKEARRHPYIASHDSAIQRIAQNIPDAKIILTLRHPIDRLISQFSKNSLQAKHAVLPNLTEHIQRILDGQSPPAADYIRANHYGQHLAKVYDHFPAEQVKVIIFEEWVEQPALAMKTLFEFLNIEPNIQLDTTTILNTTRKYASPEAIEHSEKPMLSDALSNQLQEIFKSDVAAVESILGREIPDWHKEKK